MMLLASGLALAPLAGALAGDDEQKGAGGRHDNWLQGLELTESQQEAFRSLRAEQRRALAEAEDRSARHKLRQRQRQEMYQTVRATLTDSQRDELRGRMQARHAAALDRMAEQLELTDSQQSAVREILQDRMHAGREMMRDARESAADEALDRGARRQLLREQRAAWQAETREALAAVLSSEQLEKLEAWQERRRGQRQWREGRGYQRG